MESSGSTFDCVAQGRPDAEEAIARPRDPALTRCLLGVFVEVHARRNERAHFRPEAEASPASLDVGRWWYDRHLL